MIAQQGRVLAVKGGHAVVRVGGTSGCPACDAGKGCGAGIFGRLLRNRRVSVTVPNINGAGVGEVVTVGIREDRYLALVFRLYVLPLVAGLIGAGAGFALASRFVADGLSADLLTLASGLIAAALALAASRRALREFPLQSAVHLLRESAPAVKMNCIPPDRNETPGGAAN